MNSEELDSKLNRIWATVAASGETGGQPPDPFPEPGGLPSSRAAALEALALVKRRCREHRERWEKLLEAKEGAVGELSQSLRRAEDEIARLRREAGRFDVRLVSEVSGLARKLEAAQGLLRLEEERFSREEKRLAQAVGSLGAENQKLQEREKSLLRELEDLRERSSQSRAEKERLAGELREESAAVREGREAAARAAAELLEERRRRERAEEELEETRRRLSESGARLDRLEKLWDEERKQWQELFERTFRRP